MNFGQAITHVLGNATRFEGRARRSEYWWWFLATGAVLLVTLLVDHVVFAQWMWEHDLTLGPITLLAALALLLPSVSVGCRRLHDTGLTGWLQLVQVVPVVGTPVLLALMARRGTTGPSRYGPDPAVAAVPGAPLRTGYDDRPFAGRY